MTNRATLGRGLIILAIGLFMGYRYVISGGNWYLAGLGLLGVSAGLTLAGRLNDRWQNIILNIGTTLFFFDFVFAELDILEVGELLLTASYWVFIPIFAVMFVHFLVRTVRWQWLLKPMGEVPFWSAFRALSIGMAGNIVLPARIGELMRAYILGRNDGLTKTGVFATLVVERIFDGLTILLFLLLVVLVGIENETLYWSGLVGGVVYVGLVVGLALFMWKRHWADAIVARLLPEKLSATILDLLHHFTEGLSVLKNPRQLTMVILLSIATWLFVPLSFWLALLAYDFGTPIQWYIATIMVCFIALGLTATPTPGGVGLFQVAVKAALLLHLTPIYGDNLPNSIANAVAASTILVHISQLAPQLLFGLISFMVEGISLSEVNADATLAK